MRLVIEATAFRSPVEAWAASDDEALADAWEDPLADLGSQWGQYEYVSGLAFAA